MSLRTGTRITLFLVLLLATPSKAQEHAAGYSSATSAQFFADLLRHEQHFTKDMLLLEDIVRWKYPRHWNLRAYLSHLKKDRLQVDKWDFVEGKYEKVDSLRITPEEYKAIVQFYRKDTARKWTASSVPYARLISARTAASNSKANDTLYATDDARIAQFEFSRPCFFRNGTLAMFLWNGEYARGGDGYGTFSLYIKGEYGWQEFGPVTNWEGVIKIGRR